MRPTFTLAETGYLAPVYAWDKPRNKLAITIDGEPVRRMTSCGGTRWIGFTASWAVKVDGGGWGCNVPQSLHEFKLWNRRLSRSVHAEAFAACRWFTTCDGYNILVQDRIRHPRQMECSSPLWSEATRLADRFKIHDWCTSQVKITNESPFGFKIHDYGWL